MDLRKSGGEPELPFVCFSQMDAFSYHRERIVTCLIQIGCLLAFGRVETGAW